MPSHRMAIVSSKAAINSVSSTDNSSLSTTVAFSWRDRQIDTSAAEGLNSLRTANTEMCQWTGSSSVQVMALSLARHQWVGAIRQQALTWATVDPDLSHHMASLGLMSYKLPGDDFFIFHIHRPYWCNRETVRGHQKEELMHWYEECTVNNQEMCWVPCLPHLLLETPASPPHFLPSACGGHIPGRSDTTAAWSDLGGITRLQGVRYTPAAKSDQSPPQAHLWLLLSDYLESPPPAHLWLLLSDFLQSPPPAHLWLLLSDYLESPPPAHLWLLLSDFLQSPPPAHLWLFLSDYLESPPPAHLWLLLSDFLQSPPPAHLWLLLSDYLQSPPPAHLWLLLSDFLQSPPQLELIVN